MGNDISRNLDSTLIDALSDNKKVAGAVAAAAVAGLVYNEYNKGRALPVVDKVDYGGLQIAKVLAKHGVTHMFVLSGGHVAPVYVGAEEVGIKVVDVRHEVNAVFAADAVARITGLGAAAVTAGPGVTNTVTAVQNAKMAESPVLIFGGACTTILKGRGALQDIDHIALMKTVCKWVSSVSCVRDLIPTVEKAIETARSGVPGPVFIELPMDLLWPPSEVLQQTGGMLPSPKNRSLHASLIRWYVYRHLNKIYYKAADSKPKEPAPLATYPPATGDVKTVAAMLKNAKRPVLVIGSQAMLRPWEGSKIAAAVKAMGIPTYLAGMARGLLGAGEAGSLQYRHNRGKALKEADVVILAGVVCDFRLGYGQSFSPRTKLVVVNRSRALATMNRSPTVAVIADAGLFLQHLAPHAVALMDVYGEWHATLAEREAERESQITQNAEKKTDASATLLNPVFVCKEVNKALDEKSVVVVDGGDFVGTAAYTVLPRGPLTWLDPGAFGTLGVGSGFAMGAKLMRPDHEVWVIFGDGALGFSIAEFDTFARFKIGLIAVVGNDAGWTQMIRDQERLLNSAVACRLAPTDYHTVVEGFGGKGFVVSKPEELPGVLQEAKKWAAQGVPVLVNCLIARNNFREGAISV
eukprot:Colp12_sorted_trinity150504_noHs@29751